MKLQARARSNPARFNPLPMTKQKSVLVEWEFHEGESDWNSVGVIPPQPAALAWRWNGRWWFATGVVSLLLLVLMGWLWQQAQLGLAKTETELGAAVEAELWTPERDEPMAALPAFTTQDIR